MKYPTVIVESGERGSFEFIDNLTGLAIYSFAGESAFCRKFKAFALEKAIACEPNYQYLSALEMEQLLDKLEHDKRQRQSNGLDC